MIAPGSTDPSNPPTLGDIVRARATDCENRTAIEFEGRATSYAELRDGAFRIANALIASGLEPGDRVAVLALLQTWGTAARRHPVRSEEHTSELQSLMRISYAVFCLKKTKQQPIPQTQY